MLQKLLEAQLSNAVQEQIRAGVGTIPKNDADDILTRVAQLDASKLRGIVVIVASDMDGGRGVDVQTLVAGTPATLDPLLELGSHQIDEKLQNPGGDVCPGCGEVHGSSEDFLDELLRRGPGNDRTMNFGRDPLERGNELHADLGLLFALAAMGRKR
ncbi:hypothetical protein AXL3_45 [Stenotrophomonas phage vB_SmaS-AXL_3]|uniref:Uncharacterized protein n=1 Tax=Stenotrophomonas phage vB_SmaS-AXL_3 TaxID=2740427 RepID=A0A7D4XKT4_9CAUD|nr:hypothetical protein PQE62_gp45 [Stenotrophomonas phage vB_SmaS-AXL_3]QKW95595.1 hypothetical protein AXL3_45 [Stenotrophomonas phage vB_SmaS-AXL_3]